MSDKRKKAIRERMAKTEESYSTARRRVFGAGDAIRKEGRGTGSGGSPRFERLVEITIELAEAAAPPHTVRQGVVVDLQLDDGRLTGQLAGVVREGVEMVLDKHQRSITRRGRTTHSVSDTIVLPQAHVFIPVRALYSYALGNLYVAGELVFCEGFKGPEWTFRPS